MMTERPLISVIIPVYKAEAYLDQCVQSIVAQSYPFLEIILIDDGSPDRCPEICDAWARKDARIRVVHKENAGVSCARNVGLAQATGTFVLFVDADDVLDVAAIEACILEHDGHSTSIVMVNNNRVPAEFMYHSDRIKKRMSVVTYSGLAIENCARARLGFACWGILIDKALLVEKKIFFDENLHNLEDVAFLGKLMSFINHIIFIRDPLYHYRDNPVSITSRCIDRAWQAQCWLNSRASILTYFSRKEMLDDHEIKHLKRINRYCLNNFYAECIVGKLPFSEVKRMSLRTGQSYCGTIPLVNRLCNYKITWYQYATYRVLLKLRENLIKR